MQPARHAGWAVGDSAHDALEMVLGLDASIDVYEDWLEKVPVRCLKQT